MEGSQVMKSEGGGGVVDGGGGEKDGQFFVDQTTGQYYFQSNDGETMTMVDENDTEATAGPSGSEPEKSGDVVSKTRDDQVMLNAGGDNDAYQTVTIVPSDTNSGEVSYVLIVQPEDEKKGKGGGGEGEGDDDVYDFDGEPGTLAEFDPDAAEIKKPRPSQQTTQTHMCRYCNYTTGKRYLLSRHMKSHSEERPHKCSVCERGFKTLASLQNHVNTHTGTKPHECKFCDSSFTTSGELIRHVRYRHTLERPHKCPECDYSSVELSKLKRHIRCHTGERPYQCSHCTYASPDTFKLKRHMRIHTGEKPYKCDICHARFTQSNSLKAHRMIHTGDKPVFQCELCPTTCGRKTDLRLHVQKLHTAQVPIACKMCGKTFSDRYTLKVHKKTHEGERCFKCDLCPYSSISQRHLESHMLIHTDQKPFECDQCDQTFRQRQLLKRHQNLYHNPNYVPPEPKEKTHECPECGKSFRHKGNLIRHMALHDPESSQKEKNLALKLGRQKKIQIIDGQQVEVLGGFDDEEEEGLEDDGEMGHPGMAGQDVSGGGLGDENVIPVAGEDGQHYVVLEVIQMGEGDEEDGENQLGHEVDGHEGKVKVIAGSGGHPQIKSDMVTGFGDEDQVVDDGTSDGVFAEGEVVEEDQQVVVTPKKETLALPPQKAPAPPPSTKQEVANCFGFDSDDDE